jgi:hypothetical protein
MNDVTQPNQLMLPMENYIAVVLETQKTGETSNSNARRCKMESKK